MLREDDITIRVESQGYKCESYTVSQTGKESVLLFQSQSATEAQRCPVCKSRVYVHDSGSITLRDMPIWVGCKQELCFITHRYRCTKCRACFTEEVPFKYPGTWITRRAAGWVRELLRGHNGSGRDDPGSDFGPDPPPAEGTEHDHHLHHPRPGRGSQRG